MSKNIGNEDGFILPLVLVIIALLAGGVAYILSQGLTELQANTLNQDYELCILTGKNALAVAQAELADNVDYTGTSGDVADANGGHYQITVNKIADNLRDIEVSSTFKGYQKSFGGEIELMIDGETPTAARIVRFNWKMLGIE
ncbi:hypothetical protein [Acetobacterium woodii]|uniref:Uncharacterized protein n=1 Tax=Acetobacterium woodii (strain ATCC 29683 / DSM 1030 / JCM 2381 / KCTC 1655 / WB1) TaxID=931626 RepID=H6LEU4_ACEWD|nr:hypothetical protein [Acetobacterium woodii]AFA49387.1 hypothetical protein Awo_c26310 [Acetobacterium woodii DSM 1030]